MGFLSLAAPVADRIPKLTPPLLLDNTPCRSTLLPPSVKSVPPSVNAKHH